jgi:hypothetical protein
MLLQHLSQLLEMATLRRSLLQYMDLTILALVDTLLVEAGLLFMQQEVQQVLVVLAVMEYHQFHLLVVPAGHLLPILVPVPVAAVAAVIMELTVLVVLMEVTEALAVLDYCKYFGCNKNIILYIQFLKALI